MSKYHIVPKRDFGPYGFRIRNKIALKQGAEVLTAAHNGSRYG